MSDPAVIAFPFACVILAAGAGARFGQPKAVAEVAPGVRFLDRVIESASHTGAAPILAVVPTGVTVPAPARAVERPLSGDEQIESLRHALGLLTNSPAVGALVWPVDRPFATVESALAVVDAARRTGAPIVVPTLRGRRGHPTWFARDSWRDLMVVRDGGARSVVRAYGNRVVEVDVADEGILLDVNTADDLAAGLVGRRPE